MDGRHFIEVDGVPMPVDLYTWARAFDQRDEAWRVGNDTIGEAQVSTVFLGLNHRHDAGAPLLYETMIFGGDHDEYQVRYTTREAAAAGHAAIVAWVKGKTGEPEVGE